MEPMEPMEPLRHRTSSLAHSLLLSRLRTSALQPLGQCFAAKMLRTRRHVVCFACQVQALQVVCLACQLQALQVQALLLAMVSASKSKLCKLCA